MHIYADSCDFETACMVCTIPTVVACQNKITLLSTIPRGCPTGGYSSLAGTLLPYAVLAETPVVTRDQLGAFFLPPNTVVSEIDVEISLIHGWKEQVS